MKAAELFVRSLENEGVKYVFGVPGEENLDLLEALRESPIELITTRHEAGAGFMAATYGRLTGQPGVALATLGPGATNLMTAAAQAKLGAMPMLIITGQKPVHHSKQGHFQIVDTVDMFGPVTKSSRQLVSGGAIPARVRDAFRLAREERPGPVHLELPEDVASEEVASSPYPTHEVLRPHANDQAVAQAAAIIARSHHPLLLIGASANRYRVSQALRSFVDDTAIPFFNTQMGKGVLDERSSSYVGTAALSENDYVHCAIDHADLIINAGHDVIEKPPFIMQRGSQQVIHINFFSAAVDDVYFPQHEVIGDVATTLDAIRRQLPKKRSWDLSYFAELREYLNDHIRQRADADNFPVLPQRLVADVRSVMPGDGIVALDNGMYKIWFARNYLAYQPNTLLLDNALATMGAGLPSAMAARLVNPDVPVLAVVGDGGFLMSVQELETAVRLKLNLTILVLVDNSYGMIAWKQEEMNHPGYGLTFGNPDFAKLADSFGASGHRIEQTDAIKPTLEKLLSTYGVHVVELPIDYSENHRVLYEELQAETCNL